MSSWSIVTLANEMPTHLKAFVAWHLGVGATKINLFIDDPSWSSDVFDHLPQVTAIVCTDEFWRDLGFLQRPNRAQRQKAVATYGYRHADTEWVLHADVDEFVYATDILAELAEVDGRAARIYPMERIFTDGDTPPFSNHFRAPTDERYPIWLDQVYTHPAQLDHGLRGHYVGKVFARTGLDIDAIGAHNIVLANGKSIPKSRGSLSSPLLHLFVFDFDHFRRKGEWKFSRGPGNREKDSQIADPSERDQRRIQMAEAFENKNLDAQKSLFDDLFVFSEKRLENLQKHQQVDKVNFVTPLAGFLQQYFP